MSGGYDNAGAGSKTRVVDNFLTYLNFYDYSREWAILGLADASVEEQEEFAASFQPVLIFLWRQALGFVFGDIASDYYNLFMTRYEQGRELDDIFSLRESIEAVAELGSNDHGMILIALRCVNLVNPDAEDKNDMIVTFTERLLHLLERFAKPDNGITELELETLRVRHATRSRELDAFKAREEAAMTQAAAPLDMSGLELEESPPEPVREHEPESMPVPSRPDDEDGEMDETDRGGGQSSDEEDGVSTGGGLGKFMEDQKDALQLDGGKEEDDESPAGPSIPHGFRELLDGVSGIYWDTDRDSLDRPDMEFVKSCDKTGVAVYAKNNGYLFFSDQGLIQSSMKYSGVVFARQLDYVKEIFAFRGAKDGIDYYRKDDVIVKVDKKTRKISVIRKRRKKVSQPAMGGGGKTINLEAAMTDEQKKQAMDGDGTGESSALPTPSVLGVDTFIKAFVISFFKAKGVNNWIAQNIGFYGDEVDYLSRGTIHKKDIATEYLATQQNWPDRSYQVNGDLEIVPTAESGVSKVIVPYSYVLKNKKEDVSGNARVMLLIKIVNDKGFIMAEKEA